MFPTPLGKYQGTQLLVYTVSMLSFGEVHGNPLQLVLLPGESHGQRSLAGCNTWLGSWRVGCGLSDLACTCLVLWEAAELSSRVTVLLCISPAVEEFLLFHIPITIWCFQRSGFGPTALTDVWWWLIVAMCISLVACDVARLFTCWFPSVCFWWSVC